MTAAPELTGWPAELLANVAAAPCRAAAKRLVEASNDAIAALPDDAREALLAELQDAIQELPD